MNENTPKLPNYMKEITRSLESGALSLPVGTASNIIVRHDDWCMVFNGGRCNCEPIVKAGKPNRAERRANRKK